MLFRLKLFVLLMLGLFASAGAWAQQLASPPAQFDMLGFIQDATLDTTGAICTPSDPALAGGTLTINGIKMIVPCNTILQLPASSSTWRDLFTGTQTGLALADNPAPYPSFEVRAVGNVVDGKYIVGLIVPITQQGLNAGSGFIRCIDYDSGFLYVGGAELRPGDTTCGAANGARVQINDPVGRFGKAHSPDPRFTADTNNPTVQAATGFPVCVPRVAPPGNDPLCPQGNRPLNGDPRFPVDPFLATGAFLKTFDMPAPADGQFPDARQQMPLEIGDWIDYSGTLFRDAVGDYISAHTLHANLGVFTAPGVRPAYVGVEAVLLGTDGAPLPNITQEATTRIKFEGFTTDPSRLINISAIDVNPCTGKETLRWLGTADPAAQPVRGRFRLILAGGFFMPPTREMIAVSDTGTMAGVANGLTAGQYRLPNFDFIFPENFTFGQPILPNNFQDLPFLAQGSGPLDGFGGTGPIVGQLDPWPGSPAPPKADCAGGGVAPIVDAGGDFTVASGAAVTLAGTATLDSGGGRPIIRWSQTSGPKVTLANASSLTPSFTAPTLPPGPAVALGFTLTVTDAFGTGTSSATVTVNPVSDIVTITGATWRNVKGGKLTVTATSSVASTSVVLRVVGFGAMTNLGGGSYIQNRTGVLNPVTVTVRSSLGGSARATVIIR